MMVLNYLWQNYAAWVQNYCGILFEEFYTCNDVKLETFNHSLKQYNCTSIFCEWKETMHIKSLPSFSLFPQKMVNNSVINPRQKIPVKIAKLQNADTFERQ